jgi:rhodanese-related sulfurtransferase
MFAYLKLKRICLLLPILGFIACTGIRPSAVSVSAEIPLPGITVENLRALLNADSTVFVLDVRTPEEYAGPLGHIAGALLIPVQELEPRLAELSDYRDREIYVVCRSGGRSARATRMLLDQGYRAANVTGGMQAWNTMNDDVKGQVE